MPPTSKRRRPSCSTRSTTGSSSPAIGLSQPGSHPRRWPTEWHSRCLRLQWRARQDLNLRPSAPEADALSTELQARGRRSYSGELGQGSAAIPVGGCQVFERGSAVTRRALTRRRSRADNIVPIHCPPHRPRGCPQVAQPDPAPGVLMSHPPAAVDAGHNWNLSNRQRLEILLAILLALFLFALDQTVVGTALPVIITDLSGEQLYTWSVTIYLLTATISGPIYGKLSDLFGRRPIFIWADRPLPRVVRVRRPQPGDVAVRGRAGSAGPRRRGGIPDRARGHCGPLPARGARQVRRALRRGIRAVVGARAAHRWRDHRCLRLAVDLLRQRAAGVDLPVRVLATPAAHQAPRERPEHRLCRRGAVRRRHRPIPGRPDEQAVGPMDRPVGRRADGPGRGHRCRVPVVGSARRGPDRPPRVVPESVVHDLRRLDVPGRVRLLRRRDLPAALVPGDRRHELPLDPGWHCSRSWYR